MVCLSVMCWSYLARPRAHVTRVVVLTRLEHTELSCKRQSKLPSMGDIPDKADEIETTLCLIFILDQ